MISSKRSSEDDRTVGVMENICWADLVGPLAGIKNNPKTCMISSKRSSEYDRTVGAKVEVFRLKM